MDGNGAVLCEELAEGSGGGNSRWKVSCSKNDGEEIVVLFEEKECGGRMSAFLAAEKFRREKGRKGSKEEVVRKRGRRGEKQRHHHPLKERQEHLEVRKGQ